MNYLAIGWLVSCYGWLVVLWHSRLCGIHLPGARKFNFNTNLQMPATTNICTENHDDSAEHRKLSELHAGNIQRYSDSRSLGTHNHTGLYGDVLLDEGVRYKYTVPV